MGRNPTIRGVECKGQSEPFHQLLTRSQSSLYAFISSLMGGASNSFDVLQETNLVLWEKAEQYDRSQKFLPWAFKFAHLQVLAFRTRQQRDRLIFNDELVGILADELETGVQDQVVDPRMEALEDCLAKLPIPHRELLRRYYERGDDVSAIGTALGKKANAIAARLYRIRKSLFHCVQSALQLKGVS